MDESDDTAASSLYSHCWGTAKMGHPLYYRENIEHEKRYKRQYDLDKASHKSRKRNKNAEQDSEENFTGSWSG